jgi:hypothetical protein
MSTESPEFMVSYLCTACSTDSAFPDGIEPICYVCESSEHLKEIKRLVMTPELMMERVQLLNERMMENLVKAYDEQKRNGFEDVEEKELLDLLAKAKSLHQHTEQAFRDGIKAKKEKEGLQGKEHDRLQ